MSKRKQTKPVIETDSAVFAEAVTAARAKLQLTQSAFARLLETPVGTIRGWEQGRRKPPPCAMLLMRIAVEQPEAVMAASEYSSPDASKGKGANSKQSGLHPSKRAAVVADLHEPGDEADFWLL